jgi:hypothetical protein
MTRDSQPLVIKRAICHGDTDDEDEDDDEDDERALLRPFNPADRGVGKEQLPSRGRPVFVASLGHLRLDCFSSDRAISLAVYFISATARSANGSQCAPDGTFDYTAYRFSQFCLRGESRHCDSRAALAADD